ncbi:hypothetical protein D6789_03455 [Candidatus Woesearchaeota archaeon]|nr:MAG: hypothetical protein D6789_03455 [Candidatus Woesearchaeota archaeon]
MVIEQMYHASRRNLKGDEEHDKEIAKDVPHEFKWRKPVFWGDIISIELMIEQKGRVRSHDREVGHFTLYSDKTNERLSYMSILTFWQPRSYVRDIERIRRGDDAIDDLIRKIEAQAINHRRLRSPRKTLKVTENDLVEALRRGYIPEEELHDFFSLWDDDPKISFFA